MPQHFLDGAKIGARLQQVRGEGMADPVGREMPPEPRPLQLAKRPGPPDAGLAMASISRRTPLAIAVGTSRALP